MHVASGARVGQESWGRGATALSARVGGHLVLGSQAGYMHTLGIRHEQHAVFFR